MPIYLFASRICSSVKAFTSDERGDNLPDEYAPWYATGSGAAIPVGLETGPVGKAVKRDGYFLLTDKTRTDSNESMQSCGVHYATDAIAPSSFAVRKPG